MCSVLVQIIRNLENNCTVSLSLWCTLLNNFYLIVGKPDYCAPNSAKSLDCLHQNTARVFARPYQACTLPLRCDSHYGESGNSRSFAQQEEQGNCHKPRSTGTLYIPRGRTRIPRGVWSRNALPSGSSSWRSQPIPVQC